MVKSLNESSSDEDLQAYIDEQKKMHTKKEVEEDGDEFEVVEQQAITKKIKKDKKDKKKSSKKKRRRSEQMEEEDEESGNVYADTFRGFTLTIVIPASIIDNAQSMELKTYLVGQIAKAATIFGVNEIVILSDDKQQQMKGMMQDLTTTEFFVQNLEYLETPQYLRKTLFPRSPALRFAGLMNPLDAPHHLRATEWCKYREGCVIKRPVKDKKGSWVNIGLYGQDCQVDIQL